MISHNLKSEQGFNLIELMVVVAIVGILVAVATPSYLSHRRKASQVEGIHRLLDLKAAQEKYYALNDTYYVIGNLAAADAEFRRMVNFDVTDTSMFTFSLDTLNGATIDFRAISANNLDGNVTFTDCWKISNVPLDWNGDGVIAAKTVVPYPDVLSEPMQEIGGACLADGEGVNISLF